MQYKSMELISHTHKVLLFYIPLCYQVLFDLKDLCYHYYYGEFCLNTLDSICLTINFCAMNFLNPEK